MWQDRAHRILTAPACPPLITQIASECSAFFTGAYQDMSSADHKSTITTTESANSHPNVNAAGNLVNPVPPDTYPKDIDPELADVMVEKVYDFSSHAKYASMLVEMFSQVNYANLDLSTYMQPQTAVSVNFPDFGLTKLPSFLLIPLSTPLPITTSSASPLAPSSPTAISVPEISQPIQLPRPATETAAVRFVTSLGLTNLGSPLDQVQALITRSSNPDTTQQEGPTRGVEQYINYCQVIDNAIFYLSKLEPSQHGPVTHHYLSLLTEMQKIGTSYMINPTPTTDTTMQYHASSFDTFMVNQRANRSFYSVESLRTIGYDLATAELSPCGFERAMITYNYNLGFSVMRCDLVKILTSNHPELDVQYDNANSTSVHIYLPANIPAMLKSEVRLTNKERRHSFIINTSGSVTQSGPHEDLNRQAYVYFKYILDLYQDKIRREIPIQTKRKGVQLNNEQIESQQQRIILRRDRRHDRYHHSNLPMPQWYRTVAYLIAGKIGDVDWMTTSTSTLKSDQDELIDAPREMEMMLRHQLMYFDQTYSPEVNEILAQPHGDSLSDTGANNETNSLVDKSVRMPRRTRRGRSISSTTRSASVWSLVIRDHPQLTQSHDSS